MIFYLSGPMRSYAENNFPLFKKVSAQLRAHGMDVVSPHEYGDESHSRGKLMTEDLLLILQKCDGVICLPDWQSSPGACAEVAVCFGTEKPVLEWIEDEQNLLGYRLEEAAAVSVTVPRENQYKRKIPLVGLCGFAQSGKDTTASWLVGEKGWTRVAFADALRDVLYALDPIVVREDTLNSEPYLVPMTVKYIVDRLGWDKAKIEYKEIRALLQRLGTEAGREVIDQNLWVKIGEHKIEAAGTPVVVTDCRFPNEISMVRRRNGKLIWVDRPGVGAVNNHASESSVTMDDCDGIIDNSGTIKDLQDKIDSLVFDGGFCEQKKP